MREEVKRITVGIGELAYSSTMTSVDYLNSSSNETRAPHENRPTFMVGGGTH
jgi:hypothetical protein